MTVDDLFPNPKVIQGKLISDYYDRDIDLHIYEVISDIDKEICVLTVREDSYLRIILHNILGELSIGKHFRAIGLRRYLEDSDTHFYKLVDL